MTRSGPDRSTYRPVRISAATSDVLLLAGAFIENSRRYMGLRGLRLSPRAQEALLAYPWPGNARELEYIMSRAALRAKGRQTAESAQAGRSAIVTLDIDDLGISPAPPQGGMAATPLAGGSASTGDATLNLRTRVDAFQKQIVQSAIAAHPGNLAAAARALGMDRANLIRLCTRLEIPPPRRERG